MYLNDVIPIREETIADYLYRQYGDSILRQKSTKLTLTVTQMRQRHYAFCYEASASPRLAHLRKTTLPRPGVSAICMKLDRARRRAAATRAISVVDRLHFN